jgi:hypothetical protein
MIGKVINSVAEGVESLGKSVEATIEGDFGKAGKNLARAGLEAAGIAGSALTGPAAEVVQEGIEGALDNAALERSSGDVPGPGGDGANWSIPNVVSGAAGGAAAGAAGAGPGGGAVGSVENLLGAVSGGDSGAVGDVIGEVAGGLEEVEGGSVGELLEGGVGAKMSAVGEAADLLGDLGASEGSVADKLLSAGI